MDKDTLLDIFSAALREADPYDSVVRHCSQVVEEYSKGSYRGIHILAFGKAAMGMARAAMDHLGDLILDGIAVTKRGDSTEKIEDPRIEIHEAGHPLPDEAGVYATKRITALAQDMEERDFALCLISGGTSALLVAPYPGISLQDKQTTTNLLLKAGADIGAVNTVRKHLSAVKGGRLARMIHPGRVHSLVLSDVIGDRLDVIGSGPTSPDRTTFADAVEVLSAFDKESQLPDSVRLLLAKGASGSVPETPKPGDPLFEKVRNTIVAGNGQAISAALGRAQELGFKAHVLAMDIHGEAREAGAWLAGEVRRARVRAQREGRALCLISGGETTVTVKGDGLGGRNLELALAFALAIEGEEGISLLSAGTDGGDGPTDAAGAMVDGTTTSRARLSGADADIFLSNNDSYRFFDRVGGLVKTGPTGTNVMDLQISVVTP
ncbi:MAG TPA: glycerate kinase [Deltaproteobacteria bacterium]|nr:glycerate kinase [Deltaproteobacteria bacterium]